ncbi:metallophosphoesterase [Thermoflavimicrobium dichotomicum]|uniref:Calcineurin-like phosphoesterase domain-containing protein n=1 Tax=Thermoflavimicrobium dichotomicum TaxID=46223 RepID=A0A1I3QDT3_9BACL|nr:metallophosphoesterase [Thermoflavimicrobium dichotomicum]SFJ32058.1 hypothetical protein SAMN05421852_107123 [Thermoflavimicrobium dichotomicum]
MWKTLAIFAIGDLHLSFNKFVKLDEINPETDIEKPMDIFGWLNHYDLIRDHWLKQVRSNDTVLIPGDISWAIRWEQAQYDFDWIAQLPGRKICSPGNHEYYYHSKKKIREALPEGIEWIDADYTVVEGAVVAGTRGWSLPGDPFYQEETDRKIYERQAGRLRLALEAAQKDHPDKEKIVMLHFPPITKHAKESKYMEIMKEFGVTLCIYGHMHGKSAEDAIQGEVDGIDLRLVACDALKFCPARLR